MLFWNIDKFIMLGSEFIMLGSKFIMLGSKEG